MPQKSASSKGKIFYVAKIYRSWWPRKVWPNVIFKNFKDFYPVNFFRISRANVRLRKIFGIFENYVRSYFSRPSSIYYCRKRIWSLFKVLDEKPFLYIGFSLPSSVQSHSTSLKHGDNLYNLKCIGNRQ